MHKYLLLLIVLILSVIGFILIEEEMGHPVLLVNSEYMIIKETTNGARARIKELEEEGKDIYEIVAVLEEEGYIRESEK